MKKKPNTPRIAAGEITAAELLQVRLQWPRDVVVEGLHDRVSLLPRDAECRLDRRHDRLARDRREQVVKQVGFVLFDHQQIVGWSATDSESCARRRELRGSRPRAVVTPCGASLAGLWGRRGHVERLMVSVGIDFALEQFDLAEANLARLENAWDALEKLVPQGFVLPLCSDALTFWDSVRGFH